MPNPTAPQTVTNDIKQGVQDVVTREIRRGIDANLQAVTDPAAFLAATTGAPPTLSFAKGLARQACRAWARGRTPVQGPVVDAVYAPLCNQYLGTIGEAPAAGRFEPSFTGGQCDSTVYQYVIRAELTSNPSSFPVNANGKTYGPITGWRTAVEGNRLRGYVTSRSATTAESCGVSSATLGALMERQVFDVDNRTGYNAATFRILGVCSGLDNCGSLPLGYLPPQTVPSLPTLPRYTPAIPGFLMPGIDVSIDENGDIVISVPDLDLTFTVDNPFRPVGGGGDGITAPGDQGEGDSVSEPSDEEEEGTDPTRNLVGVRVNVVSTPPRVNTNSNSVESYYKGLYYVFFAGDGGEFMDTGGAIVRSSQYFYAPKGCNSYRVVPNLGVSLTVQPFFERE